MSQPVRTKREVVQDLVSALQQMLWYIDRSKETGVGAVNYTPAQTQAFTAQWRTIFSTTVGQLLGEYNSAPDP